jgi:hypothetical protein
MRAYLKSNLPCSGVPVPLTRSIVKSEARQRPPRSVAALGATAAALWRSAGYREERHAATALTGLRLARAEISLLPLYQEMITTGAWWDHVDEVAHRICAILLAHPDRTRPVLLAWSRDPDLWLRRSAVISQLDARGDRYGFAACGSSSRTWPITSSSFARPSAGRCASTPEPTRTGSARSYPSMPSCSARSPVAKRPGTWRTAATRRSGTCRTAATWQSGT